MGNIHVVKETTLTVEKNSLVLVIPFLASISLQISVDSAMSPIMVNI